jgi:hypothetical protein
MKAGAVFALEAALARFPAEEYIHYAKAVAKIKAGG